MRRVRSVPSLLTLAATLVACATPTHVREDVGALRTHRGVCAGTSYLNPEGRRIRLQGCLRIGFAGTPFDNREARLVTELEAEEPDDADLTDWQVEVRRDGERVLNRALDAGPSHPRCPGLLRGCHERVADVAVIAQGLGQGTYTLRYRLMSKEAYVAGKQPAELTIVLR